MRNKLVALMAAIAGFGALAAMPSVAAASSPYSSCPSGTSVSAYCSCPPGEQVGAYCLTTNSVFKPYVFKKIIFKIVKQSPALSFWLHYGKTEPLIKAVTVKLPAGLTWKASRFKTNGVVAGVYSVKAKGGSVVLAFQSPQPILHISFAKGSIVESKAFAKQVAKKKIKKITFKIVVKDAKGTTTTISETVTV